MIRIVRTKVNVSLSAPPNGVLAQLIITWKANSARSECKICLFDSNQRGYRRSYLVISEHSIYYLILIFRNITSGLSGCGK